MKHAYISLFAKRTTYNLISFRKSSTQEMPDNSADTKE